VIVSFQLDPQELVEVKVEPDIEISYQDHSTDGDEIGWV
jgi:hypothetical protein